MRRLVFGLIPMFAAACLADPNETEVVEQSGEDVYRQPVIDGNTFTCATCHALTESAQDGLRRPGHALGGAPSRASYKNGQLPAMVDAVNSCLTEWMGASTWTEDDPRFVALQGFLADEATPEGMQELNFDIVLPPAQTDGGDADRGQALFNESCVVCHGTDGHEQGSTLTLQLPEGRDLDELEGISVWCVAVGIDFGSGSFP